MTGAVALWKVVASVVGCDIFEARGRLAFGGDRESAIVARDADGAVDVGPENACADPEEARESVRVRVTVVVARAR